VRPVDIFGSPGNQWKNEIATTKIILSIVIAPSESCFAVLHVRPPLAGLKPSQSDQSFGPAAPPSVGDLKSLQQTASHLWMPQDVPLFIGYLNRIV
jgi:hypothetical protein